MRQLTFLLLLLCFFAISCKDDVSWKAEINSIKEELTNQKKMTDLLQNGITIKSVIANGNGYNITFSENTVVKSG